MGLIVALLTEDRNVVMGVIIIQILVLVRLVIIPIGRRKDEVPGGKE